MTSMIPRLLLIVAVVTVTACGKKDDSSPPKKPNKTNDERSREPISLDALNTTTQLSARAGHTAVWCASRLYIWGGYNDDGPLNSGASLDPTTGTWTKLNTNGPTSRFGHSAICTDNEMLIWGGFTRTNQDSSSLPTNTGGRYFPDLDRWQSINSAQAPSPRADAIVVWTGTSMLVWGGRGEGGALNDGKIYAPASDAWAEISQTNAPQAVTYQRGLWLSGKFLVIGGGPNAAAASGIYDPGLAPEQAWRRISAKDMPTDQCDFTLVSAGTKLVLFGGASCANPAKATGSGATYDLATDVWTPIQAGHPRSAHTAVWTGGFMLIWGGINAGSTLAGGGLFNPRTNVWTATEATSYDTRKLHTATWTGTEVLVWGGTDQNNAYLNTGHAISVLTSPGPP